MKSQLAIVVALAFMALVAADDLSIDPRTKQSVGAKGLLTCNGNPATNVLVKLYDKEMLFDDKLGQTKTNDEGYFQLQGSTHEATTIDPKFYIYHDCNDGIMPCQRRFGIAIPNEFVTNGAFTGNLYDAGTIELSGAFSGESRDCIH